jgi:hypothetical protein
VQYVDQSTAQQMGLINGSTTESVSWGVDSTNQTPEGRPSVRISSKKSYNSGLVVLDVEHMPFGCGTWPAFWMVGPDWPNNGEIDILEGVNDQENNGMTLHTGAGCSISSQSDGAFSGTVETDNCDVKAPDQNENAGCSIKHPSKQSYGAGLNDNQGGVYATQWTDDAISVFFFPRGEIPEDALGDSPNPDNWGIPAAKFSGGCDIAKTFQEQQIVFDTTFCGDWAGNVWESGSCASKAATCDEYVQNNPEAFTDAYWTIKALRVYQDNGEAPAPSSSAVPLPSSSAVPVPSVIPSETETPIGSPISTLYPSVPLPTDSKTVPTGPSVPLPTSEPALSTAVPPENGSSIVVPSGSRTRRPHFSASSSGPSRVFDSLAPTATAPTDGNDDTQGGMGGFVWPSGSGGGQGTPDGTTTAAPVESTGASQPNATAPVFSLDPSSAPAATSGGSVPTTIISQPVPSAPETNVAIPSTTAPAPTAPAEAPTDDGPDVVQTVYETVYVTVSPQETPAPGSRKARHVRDHRRRITQHHAKR